MYKAACCLLLLAAVLATAAPEPERAPARTGASALPIDASPEHHLPVYVQQRKSLGLATKTARPAFSSPAGQTSIVKILWEFSNQERRSR